MNPIANLAEMVTALRELTGHEVYGQIMDQH